MRNGLNIITNFQKYSDDLLLAFKGLVFILFCFYFIFKGEFKLKTEKKNMSQFSYSKFHNLFEIYKNNKV